ncbi:DUF6114 domain-containing protein [Streptomyces sp. NPDC055287]
MSLGLGGLAAIGIGIGIGLALIAADLFLWFLPHTRHCVSVNALLSVLSFAATNLGGFVVGMGLGIAGSAMGFGWTPVRVEEREESSPLREGQGPRTLAARCRSSCWRRWGRARRGGRRSPGRSARRVSRRPSPRLSSRRTAS